MRSPFQCLLLIGLLLTFSVSVHAQIGFNSGAGVKPKQDVEMYTRNGFLVQSKYIPVTTDPAASINNISCVANPPVLTALAGTLKDPNGDSPYTAGVTYDCSQTISIPYSTTNNYPLGIEFTFSQLDTELNADKVIIDGIAGKIEFSGNSLPAAFVYPSTSAVVYFKTNNNATVGQGFRLQWRALLADPGLFVPLAPTPFGYSMYFGVNDFSGAFRAGFLSVDDTQDMGGSSVALGYSNIANGFTGVALGNKNIAGGDRAVTLGSSNTTTVGGVAIGTENTVVGEGNAAMGFRNSLRSGSGSIALGVSNTLVASSGGGISTGVALGNGNYIAGGGMTMGYSNTTTTGNNVAIGQSSRANGLYGATALGYLASASHIGSLVIGDGTPVNNDAAVLAGTGSTANAQFTARFRGGARFITDFNVNTGGSLVGVQLTAGGNAWSAISDSTKKERFLPLNYTDLLTKIRTLRLGTWNYKGQRSERHYGPMAQDFFARFGRDALGVIGCDTLLNSHDFTAVTLSGVQALALENEQLKARITQLELQARQTDRDRLHTATRLEALERYILIRPAPRTAALTRRKRTR